MSYTSDRTKRGIASESLSHYYFLKKGYSVLAPISHDNPFDFVVLKNGEFKKVQVKSTISERVSIRKSSKKHYSEDKAVSVRYKEDEIDLLCLHFISTGNFYVLEFNQVKGMYMLRESTIKKLDLLFSCKVDE